jgi:hypothetical protein
MFAHNTSVQTTPVCAFGSFPSQVPGASERGSLGSSVLLTNNMRSKFLQGAAILAITISLSGCASDHPESSRQPNLVNVETSHLQALATRAILSKYPNYRPEDLAFASIEWSLHADGMRSLAVTYNLPKTERTRTIASTPTTSFEYLTVNLTESGEVKNIQIGARYLQAKKPE